MIRNPVAVAETEASVIAGDLIETLILDQHGPWGIYDRTGKKIAASQYFLGLDFSKEYRVSDAPMEQGAFQSYNKVETPFLARVTLACDGTGFFGFGGSSAFGFGSTAGETRQAFLAAIAAAVSSTDVFSIVTPDATYVNSNLVHYDYTRTHRQGVSLLAVTVGFQEIRTGAIRRFAHPQTPDGAETTNTGLVQAQTPTSAQAAPASTVGVN